MPAILAQEVDTVDTGAVVYNGDRLLTVPEAARRLRIARATAYKMCQRGELPVVRISAGAVRVPADALEQFIRERTYAVGQK